MPDLTNSLVHTGNVDVNILLVCVCVCLLCCGVAERQNKQHASSFMSRSNTTYDFTIESKAE